MSENHMAFVVVGAAAAVAIGGAAIALTYHCCQDLTSKTKRKSKTQGLKEQRNEGDHVSFDHPAEELGFDHPAEELEHRTNVVDFTSRTATRKPSARTVEEIKSRYGRPSKKTSLETSSIASEARDKLLERGEKLQAVNEKTQELHEQAESFASLAEELANKMKNRKWWQI